MSPVTLPTAPQRRENLGITPMNARIFLMSPPKVGKTTLLSRWAPPKTLIVDTQHGTDMLDDEHFVQHVANWLDFEQVVDLVAAGGHSYQTIGLDIIDDLYKFCDAYVAERKGQVAAGLIDYGKGTAETEALFRRAIGKLLASPYGIWFCGHADIVEINKIQKYVPVLDKRVRNYITGACGFILIAERTGPKRILHTQPSERFEAGSRIPLPEPLDMDARALYDAMAAGMNGNRNTNGNGKTAPTTSNGGAK